MRRIVVLAGVALTVLVFASAAAAAVLRVGTFEGIKGQYTSIQKAVDAAKPGDWILVAPGDYKEHTGRSPKGRSDVTAGVLINKDRLRLRGMNRNPVIADGTNRR
jgi:hypothetical protein